MEAISPFDKPPRLSYPDSMRVEVDQSGKMEHTNIKTVLAFSNHKGNAIIIPARVKQECLKVLRAPDKFGKILKLFAASLFLLLKDYIHQLDLIIVDLEYPGREGDIRGMLLNYLRKTDPSFPRDKIAFQRIGKGSSAHKKALEIYRRRSTKGLKKVTTDELLEILIYK